MGKKRFEVKGAGCYSEQVCDVHDVEWRMVFRINLLRLLWFPENIYIFPVASDRAGVTTV